MSIQQVESLGALSSAISKHIMNLMEATETPIEVLAKKIGTSEESLRKMFANPEHEYTVGLLTAIYHELGFNVRMSLVPRESDIVVFNPSSSSDDGSGGTPTELLMKD
jgi:ABC-type dipeptide/oligopeptide/nickel transport system ATPase component